MSEKLMQALAAMAESRPLRALYILCDSQKQVSTGKLREYLDHAGDALAGYAATLRHEFDRLAAAPAAPVVQAEKAEQEPVGHDLDGLAGDLLVAADLVRNKAVSSRLVEYSRHVAKLAYCTPAPDAALVEALRNMLAAFDNPIARRKLGGEFSRQAIESARAALAGKGGE